MKVSDARTGTDWLERGECLRRLASEEVGRLAFVARGRPHIIPVNYVLDGESIAFRTSAGIKHDAVGATPVCFEIDSFDRVARTGWDVVVLGRLEEAEPSTAKGRRVRGLPIEPWAAGDKLHWLRLVPDHITGRIVGGSPGGADDEESAT